MVIKDSEMSSLVKIAETVTNNLVLSLNNLSYYPSKDLQERIIAEWKEKGLRNSAKLGENVYELGSQHFYISRLLGHADVNGQFILNPEQNGGFLSVTSVDYGDNIRGHAPPQICDPLVLGFNKHVIDNIANLNTEKGRVTLYTTDETGSKWSLHCGRQQGNDSSYKK